MAGQSERYEKLRTRYEAISSRANAGDSLVPDTAYADFLKQQDFSSLPHTVPDLGSLRKGGGVRAGRGLPSKPRPLSANAIRERARESLEESNRRLQAIEDHMWQHHQDERELRRAEMDIQKQRKHLQRQMKTYKHKVAKRQNDETRTLLEKEAELVRFQQRDLHQRGEATKDRTQQSLAGRQKLNEQAKKFMRTENRMSWQYQNLVQALERKRSEVKQLSTEFEDKIRAKEEEQHRLKQELAQVAITLNMEAQKRRQMAVDGEQSGKKATLKKIEDSRTRDETLCREERSKVVAGTRYENHRRGHDQSLKSRQEALHAKYTQEGRNLADVRTRLQQNTDVQRLTNQEAGLVQLAMQGTEAENRLRVVEAKRRAREEELNQQRRQKNAREVAEWERRIMAQENEARRREHEERLRQLSRLVSHQDGLEQALYSKAKAAEAQRKKQDQVVGKMQADLEVLRKQNAKRLKDATVQAQKAELELQQKITREVAELTKAANESEESVRSLAVHRQRAKEDRRMLNEERKEHLRRTKIADRTTLQATTA